MFELFQTVPLIEYLMLLRVAFVLVPIATNGVSVGDIVGATVVAVCLDMTGACMSFVIGERMYLSLKR